MDITKLFSRSTEEILREPQSIYKAKLAIVGLEIGENEPSHIRLIKKEAIIKKIAGYFSLWNVQYLAGLGCSEDAVKCQISGLISILQKDLDKDTYGIETGITLVDSDTVIVERCVKFPENAGPNPEKVDFKMIFRNAAYDRPSFIGEVTYTEKDGQTQKIHFTEPYLFICTDIMNEMNKLDPTKKKQTVSLIEKLQTKKYDGTILIDHPTR